MQYSNNTYVPNYIFDSFLPVLTLAELKVYLIIVRQTNGWVNKATGTRKQSDRISRSQFMTKTGLSRYAISMAVDSLIKKGLIIATDSQNRPLQNTVDRVGQQEIFYSPTKPKLNFKESGTGRTKTVNQIVTWSGN